MGYTEQELSENYSRAALKVMLSDLGGTPGTKKKEEIVQEIVRITNGGTVKPRSRRGRPSFNAIKKYHLNGETLETLVMDNPTKFNYEDDIKGLFELCEEGFGFLRSKESGYTTKIAFVSKSTIKASDLRNGDFVVGKAEQHRENDVPEIIEIISINGNICVPHLRPNFDELIPLYPDNRLTLASEENDDCTLRAIDLFCPIGKGQRSLFVVPPRTDKTMINKKIIAVAEQNENMKVIVLSIDERPEDISECMSFAKNSEVFSSSFVESPEHHIRITNEAVNHAKRLVEEGMDVLLVIDSLTKLTKAYNSLVNGKDSVDLSIDYNAFVLAKKIYSTARNLEKGSLTIIGTVYENTGNQLDEITFNEFKDAANMTLVLRNNHLAKKSVAAFDIYASNNLKDDILLSELEYETAEIVRQLCSKGTQEFRENMVALFRSSKNNEEFCNRVISQYKIK